MARQERDELENGVKNNKVTPAELKKIEEEIERQERIRKRQEKQEEYNRKYRASKQKDTTFSNKFIQKHEDNRSIPFVPMPGREYEVEKPRKERTMRILENTYKYNPWLVKQKKKEKLRNTLGVHKKKTSPRAVSHCDENDSVFSSDGENYVDFKKDLSFLNGCLLAMNMKPELEMGMSDTKNWKNMNPELQDAFKEKKPPFNFKDHYDDDIIIEEPNQNFDKSFYKEMKGKNIYKIKRQISPITFDKLKSANFRFNNVNTCPKRVNKSLEVQTNEKKLNGNLFQKIRKSTKSIRTSSKKIHKENIYNIIMKNLNAGTVRNKGYTNQDDTEDVTKVYWDKNLHMARSLADQLLTTGNKSFKMIESSSGFPVTSKKSVFGPSDSPESKLITADFGTNSKIVSQHDVSKNEKKIDSLKEISPEKGKLTLGQFSLEKSKLSPGLFSPEKSKQSPLFFSNEKSKQSPRDLSVENVKEEKFDLMDIFNKGVMSGLAESVQKEHLKEKFEQQLKFYQTRRYLTEKKTKKSLFSKFKNSPCIFDSQFKTHSSTNLNLGNFGLLATAVTMFKDIPLKHNLNPKDNLTPRILTPRNATPRNIFSFMETRKSESDSNSSYDSSGIQSFDNIDKKTKTSNQFYKTTYSNFQYACKRNIKYDMYEKPEKVKRKPVLDMYLNKTADNFGRNYGLKRNSIVNGKKDQNIKCSPKIFKFKLANSFVSTKKPWFPKNYYDNIQTQQIFVENIHSSTTNLMVYTCYFTSDEKPRNLKAVKIYPKQYNSDNIRKLEIMYEANILKFMNHENIVDFEDQLEDYDNIYIVQEYLKQYITQERYITKTLHKELNVKLINRLNTNKETKTKQAKINKGKMKVINHKKAKTVILQIIKGLEYQHDKEIYHRKLCTENILVNPFSLAIKIVGFSKALCNENNKLLTNFRRNSSYLAPEVLFGKPYDEKLVDIWAAGVVIYKIFMNKFPFGNTLKIIKMNLSVKKVYLDMDFESPFYTSIKKIFEIDPTLRPSMEELTKNPIFEENLFITKNDIAKSSKIKRLLA